MSTDQLEVGPFLMEVYDRLYQAYGPQFWWPAETRFEVVAGAILTQAAAWSNVEQALSSLKAAGCFSPQALRDMAEAKLAELIRSSGYFNAKARKLKAFVTHLWERYAGDLDAMLSRDGDELRQELLGIYGIGEETADDIVLYAAGWPSFVIDSYTRRIVDRLGLDTSGDSYSAYQKLFHGYLPGDAPLFNEYHALLDRHAKEACRRQPLCQDCCLLDLCATGKQVMSSDGTGLGSTRTSSGR